MNKDNVVWYIYLLIKAYNHIGDLVKKIVIIMISLMFLILGSILIKNESVPVSQEATLENVSIVIDPGHGGVMIFPMMDWEY